MKYFFCTILFTSAVLFLNAQIRKIPADVTDAFTERYPHATHVEWKDKLQYFEADFKLNDAEINADFSSKGEWLSSERAITFDDLPTEVKDGFKKSKYATDWTVKDVYEVQDSAKPLKYKISVYKNGLQKKNLFFDADGKLLKEVITL